MKTDKSKAIPPCMLLQYARHTHGLVLNKGKANERPNTSPSAGTPYPTITPAEILAMVKAPPSVDKLDGKSLIPSAYHDHDGRGFGVQRAKGSFWWLPADIDRGNPSKAALIAAVRAVLGVGVGFWVYSTKSATKAKRKWRVLVQLAAPVAGVDYGSTQRALIALMQEAGVTLDPVMARAGQIAILPNRGKFYDFHIETGGPLSLATEHPIMKRKAVLDEALAIATKDADATRAKRDAERKARLSSGEVTTVEHFNARHTIADLFDKYGYTPAGDDDWTSPNSGSGSPSTHDFGDHWVTLGSGDLDEGVGRVSEGGNATGDAFDLYVAWEHGGDYQAAVSAYHKAAGIGSSNAKATFSEVDMPVSTGSNSATVDDSQDGLANGLGASGWDQDARYVAAWGKWLFWTGARWELDEKLRHLTLCREYLRLEAAKIPPGKNGENLGKPLKSKATVAAIADLAQSNPDSAASADDFDVDLMLLGTPDGTVDLKTGTLRPARRADMMTKLCAVAPAPVGSVPTLWLEFLDKVLDGDADLIAFMQRLVGYALTGQTSEHKLAFLHGTGRNGKSVFLDTVYWLLGDYSKRVAADTLIATNTTQHSTGIAGLKGARFVASSELPKGKSWNESIIKDLTGGDVMSARLMRQNYFDFTPQLTLFVAGNSKPRLREVSEAMRARLMLVPFTVTIPASERDTGLKDKLEAEGPAILRWAIEGCIEWQRRGLDVPPAVTAASAAYFEQEDVVGLFLADETDKVAGGFANGDELIERFNQWRTRQGFNMSWTKAALLEGLREKGFPDKRKMNGRGIGDLVLRVACSVNPDGDDGDDDDIFGVTPARLGFTVVK